MDKRPRIKNELRGEVAPIDLLAFTNVEKIEFDIWFDKHFYIREQHGDKEGKRDGICIDIRGRIILWVALKSRTKFLAASQY